MARRYLVRPRCALRLEIDTVHDVVVGGCECIESGTRVSAAIQACEVCKVDPNDLRQWKELTMPAQKTPSKSNGGAKPQPMLPSLNQLPTLPGFDAPPAVKAAEENPVTMPPIVEPSTGEPVNLQNPPQKTVRLKPEPPQASSEMPDYKKLPPMPGMQPHVQPAVETPTVEPQMPPQMPQNVPMPEAPKEKPVGRAAVAPESELISGMPSDKYAASLVTPASPIAQTAVSALPNVPEPVAQTDAPAQEAMPPVADASTVPPEIKGQFAPMPGTPGGMPHPQLAPQPVQMVSEPPAADAFTAEAASAVSLADLMAGVSGEDAVDVNAALDEVPGLMGGPSVGGFSWHTLEPCFQCWRKAWYKHVEGLVSQRPHRALNWGSLWHACWELWYRSGGQRAYDEPCDAVRQAGAPKLAGEVQRLMYAMLKQYAEEEASTWDIRGVETNGIFWMEPERIDGKTVHVPISCRHDLIIAKRKPGSACHPEGPVPHGCYVCDHKSASALTYDLTKGYAMDGQFKTNALVYMKSGEVERFGPFNGIIVSIVVKHKNPKPESFKRIETSVSDKAIAEFYQYEIKPYALEFYRRLASERYRGDINLWPRNTTHCVNRYGCCEFFDLCDIGGSSVKDAMFKVDESRIFSLDKLHEPPMEIKRSSKLSDPKKKAAEEARKERMAKRKEYQEALIAAFSQSAQAMEAFDSKHFLAPNSTDKDVLDKLTEALKTSWQNGMSFGYPLQDEKGQQTDMFTLTIGPKGINWVQVLSEEQLAEGKDKKGKKPAPFKGTMSYKAIAEAICEDWWDLNRLDPKDAE